MAKGKYKRKRILRELREVPIKDSALSEFIVKALNKAGLNNMADLMLKNESQLKEIPGIGDKAMQEILNLRKNWKVER